MGRQRYESKNQNTFFRKQKYKSKNKQILLAKEKQPQRIPKVEGAKDIATFEKSYYHSAKQEIKFLIPNQEQKKLVHSIRNNSISLVTGNAGTGKTLFCIQTLYQMLKAGAINQILIIRLMTEKKEKTGEYWQAIRDNMERFVSEGEINYLFDKDKIKMLPVSFVRGRTFHNKRIIVEESQNISEKDLLTITTRIGEGSRMIFNGTDSQVDISGRRGMKYLKQLLTDLDDVGVIEFVSKVNPRHPLITYILERADELKRKKDELKVKQKELNEHMSNKEKHSTGMGQKIANVKWDVDLDFYGQSKQNNLNHG
jgi:phosphate starvation-inducible protein PhoH